MRSVVSGAWAEHLNALWVRAPSFHRWALPLPLRRASIWEDFAVAREQVQAAGLREPKVLSVQTADSSSMQAFQTRSWAELQAVQVWAQEQVRV